MPAEVPQCEVVDNDYKSRPDQTQIPVQGDDKPIEDPIDPATADSDEQLGEASKRHVNCSQLTFPSSQGRRRSH